MNASRSASLRQPGTTHRRGFALISTLVLMIGLMVMAVVTLKVVSRGERMAGSDLDRALALQLAEATVRDAQQDIMRVTSAGAVCTGAPCRPMSDLPNKDSGITDLSYIGTCRQGMCYLGPGSEAPATVGDPGSLYDNADFVAPWDRPDPGEDNAARPYARYGEFTGASWETIRSASGAATRPRYWVEVIPMGTASDKFLFRITARATGRNAATVVVVQEVYQPW
ncbi:MAG: pilus assembly PilX family protein [Rubrivivax sp.]